VPDRTIDRNGSQDLFYAKILLFGEYSLILNSMALLIPFSRYTARFSFPYRHSLTGHFPAPESNAILRQYSSWLGGINKPDNLKGVLDTDAFKRDVEDGLFLESDIPGGYGLGSSGALCAAVYDRYAVNRINNDPSAGIDVMRSLKKTFALMESWFHGTSSGMDPLSCYFRRPLLLEPGEKIRITDLPDQIVSAIFLVDTGRPGNTGPLVKLFLDMSKERSFSEKMESMLIPAVDSCIRSVLGGDDPGLMAGIETISRFQLTCMKAMIPASFIKIWEEGLASGDYYLKLCGSGGGGFLLGFTRDFEKTSLNVPFNLSTI
jgi:mevalonate kinase